MPRRHLNPHLEGGVVGANPPYPTPHGRGGLPHPLHKILVTLRIPKEGISIGVIEAYPSEVSVAGVVGEADFSDKATITKYLIVRITGIGGPSSLLGAIVSDTIGERGGGVHHAKEYGADL